jgi:hypothetical protein
MLGKGLGFLELTLIPHYLGFPLAGKRLLDGSLARRRQAREEHTPAASEPAA